MPSRRRPAPRVAEAAHGDGLSAAGRSAIVPAAPGASAPLRALAAARALPARLRRRMTGAVDPDLPLALVVGLGNPGPEHARDRHNVGFMAVAELARRHGIALTRKQKKALVGTGEIAGRRVLLAQPQTWMNDSGKALKALRDFYRVPPAAALVIFDDLDLPLGRLRVRADGSAGGHHGLESIIRETGTMAYPRVRIGIGRPATREEVIDFVLAPFHRDELADAEAAVGRAADAAERWLVAGVEAAMQAAAGGPQRTE